MAENSTKAVSDEIELLQQLVTDDASRADNNRDINRTGADVSRRAKKFLSIMLESLGFKENHDFHFETQRGGRKPEDRGTGIVIIASRNQHFENQHDYITGWNTFAWIPEKHEERVAKKQKRIYVLSVEDTHGIPQFFIFKEDDMQAIYEERRNEDHNPKPIERPDDTEGLESKYYKNNGIPTGARKNDGVKEIRHTHGSSNDDTMLWFYIRQNPRCQKMTWDSRINDSLVDANGRSGYNRWDKIIDVLTGKDK